LLKIDVPLEWYKRDGWCLPACVKMVLRHLRNVHGDGIQILSQNKIAKICHTNEVGTEYDANQRLNEITVKFTPSVEFYFRSNCQIKTMIPELGEFKPVIAFMEMPSTEYEDERFPHAVVVTGIDKTQRRIIYNDPIKGKDEKLTFGAFRSYWASDFCLWLLGLNWQKKLPRGDE